MLKKPVHFSAQLLLLGANDTDTTAPPDLSELTVQTELLDSFGGHVPSSQGERVMCDFL